MRPLAVFDIDGTLVDSRASIHRAACEAARDIGLPEPDYDRVRQIVGEREWPIILAILEDRPIKTAGPALGVSESRISQLKTALFARLQESSLKSFLEDQLCRSW